MYVEDERISLFIQETLSEFIEHENIELLFIYFFNNKTILNEAKYEGMKSEYIT